MDKNNIYDVKKLKMPVSISSGSKSNVRNKRQVFSPGSLFLLTLQQGMEINNRVGGGNLKKYNLFDFCCLHGCPDKTAFEQMYAFSLLYKSELKNLDEVAADNATAWFICKNSSEEFFRHINESGDSVVKCGNGIYRANAYMLIDIYIIVVSELREPEYKWMKSIISQTDGKCPEICINGLICSFGIVEY